jgi:hypothetical protein
VYGPAVDQPQGVVQSLRLIYRPSFTVFGFGSDLDTLFYPSWAGIMFETDLPRDNSRTAAMYPTFLEIRLRASGGRMHIDMGRINEDINGDNQESGEDHGPDGNHNWVVDQEEDVGLDGLADVDEPGYDPLTNPDPHRDNWYFRNEGKCPYPAAVCEDPVFQTRMEDPDDPIYYEWLNGTEGNREDPTRLGRPDDERLLGHFDTDDHYYTCLIDFDSNPDSFLVRGSEYYEWRTYRIPIGPDNALADELQTVGNNADWERFTHARIWFESGVDADGFDTVEIVDCSFVQPDAP